MSLRNRMFFNDKTRYTGTMQNIEKTTQDTPEGTERGQNLTAKAGKTHVAYWKQRLKKREFRNGRKLIQIPNWQVRMKHLNKDGWFNLKTENADTAASEARKIY